MQYWNLHDVNITAFDGYLMAILVNTSRASYFPYDSVAKLETSVVFESNYFVFLSDHSFCIFLLLINIIVTKLN